MEDRKGDCRRKDYPTTIMVYSNGFRVLGALDTLSASSWICV